MQGIMVYVLCKHTRTQNILSSQSNRLICLENRLFGQKLYLQSKPVSCRRQRRHRKKNTQYGECLEGVWNAYMEGVWNVSVMFQKVSGRCLKGFQLTRGEGGWLKAMGFKF